MADKNRTPDILGSVLNTSAPTAVDAPAQPKAVAKKKAARQQDGKALRQNDGKTEKRQNDTPEKRQDGIPVKQQDGMPEAEAEKVKATFYLAPDAVEGLEDAWLQLRRMARSAGRKRAVSKSEIVEAALQVVLEDLAAHGEDSLVVGRLFGA